MKSLKSKIKKVLVILASIMIIAVAAIAFLAYSNHNIMFWEYPNSLSKKTETIEVSYVRWACACANWLPLPRENPDAEIKDTDCIFIEAVTKDLIVPDSFFDENQYRKKLKLTGSYYNDVGIPRTYEMPTSQRPDKAKVFRYSKMEVVKR